MSLVKWKGKEVEVSFWLDEQVVGTGVGISSIHGARLWNLAI